jgi:L-asparaginase
LPFKLHIIYTGGTLGMQAGEKGLVPASFLGARLKAVFAASGQYKNQLEMIDWSLTECTPLLDSANVAPTDWERMANQCLAHKQADAIILVHGTDTLAYTSCARAYLLKNIDIPIIIPGSQKPLEAPGSDALDNLAGAMLEAGQTAPGVWVYFDQRLMPGARVVKKDAIQFAGFDTPRLLGSPESNQPTQIGWQASPRDWGSIQVANIHMVPAYPAPHLDALLATQPHAIILSLYGLGTLCDQNTELLEALRNARKQGTILVAISQCYVGRIDFSAYATGAQLAQIGVLNGHDLTLEAAYTKLMILFRLGYSGRQTAELFEQNLSQEMSIQPGNSG